MKKEIDWPKGNRFGQGIKNKESKKEKIKEFIEEEKKKIKQMKKVLHTNSQKMSKEGFGYDVGYISGSLCQLQKLIKLIKK